MFIGIQNEEPPPPPPVMTPLRGVENSVIFVATALTFEKACELISIIL